MDWELGVARFTGGNAFMVFSFLLKKSFSSLFFLSTIFLLLA